MTYSNTLALAVANMVESSSQNLVSFKEKVNEWSHYKYNYFNCVSLSIGLLYLTQVTKTNSYGYEINSLQQQQTQLQNQNSQLQVTSASLQAVSARRPAK